MSEILIGNSKVRVETEDNAYELEKIDEDTLINNQKLPEDLQQRLREEGFKLQGSFPQTITRYFHDEASPYDRSEVSDELGLPEDSDAVRRISGYGHEISVTFRVDSPDEVTVVSIDNRDLENERSL